MTLSEPTAGKLDDFDARSLALERALVLDTVRVTEQAAIATGDQFITGTEKKDFLSESFDAAACDMEGGAIAQCCYEMGVPYAACRCISDTRLGDGREYLDLCHKACESGELPPSINIVRLYETGRQGERMVNATQFNHIRPLDPEHVFEAEYQLRQQIRQVVFFLKNNIPGFADIHVNGSSTTLGARESRRVIGDYILTGDDLIAGRKFEDAVVHNASFCIDIHNPDGAGQAETDGCPHLAQPYDIPYRSLRPLGVDNLLTAGRCISGDHRAHASYRVMNICMAMGQAAGAAASLAVKGGTGTRGVDIDELKQLTHTV